LLNRYLGIPSPEEVVDSIRGKSFREMLPVLLDYSGDSLWTLAANAGVSREGIEKWLKGTTPTLNSMRKVASYFATRHRFPSADLLDAFEGLYGLESPESLMPTVEGSADFGRALRAIHLGRKYSFNDIARATDVDPRTARGWEYNGTYPSAEEFGKLLHYLCDIQRFNRHSLEPTLRRLWGGPSHEVRSVPQVNEIALPTGLMPINPFAWRYPHSSRPDAVAMTGGFFEEIAVRYLVQILLFSSAMGLSSWLSVILFAVFFATVFHPKMFIGK
jgi:transcriptional regulator with XRE-family HTH domain